LMQIFQDFLFLSYDYISLKFYYSVEVILEASVIATNIPYLTILNQKIRLSLLFLDHKLRYKRHGLSNGVI